MSTITQQISQLPEYPSRANPTSFNEKAEAWMAAEQTMTTQLNTFATQANALRASVNTLQSSATASASLAATAKTGADSAAALAISAAGATAYNAATVYTFGKSVIGSNGIAYRFVGTTGVAGDNPVTSATGNWKLAITGLQATIDQIAGLAPTLDLDFARQVYRHYTPALGLREKPLSDIVTFTRASDAQYWDAKGVMRLAGNNVPRIDFDSVTGACKGLLIEEARTNLLAYSEQFDNAAWTKLNTAVTANAVIAPNGTLTADKVTETTDSGQHFMSYIGLPTTNATYTSSVFVKKGDYSTFYLQAVSIGASSTSSEAAFSISDTACAVVGTPTGLISAATVNAVGNGWYRCAITYTTNGTVTNHQFRIFTKDISIYTGVVGSGLYIWGAQVEQGAFPTSYIPTTTAAATRAADVAVISGAAFSDFYRQGVGSFVVDIALFQTPESAICYLPRFYNSTGPSEISFRHTNIIAGTDYYIVKDGTTQFDSGSVPTPKGGYKKLAGGFASDDASFVYAGGAPMVKTSEVSIPDVLELVIKSNNVGCAHIARLTYWPTRLPNATLQQLTAG